MAHNWGYAGLKCQFWLNNVGIACILNVPGILSHKELDMLACDIFRDTEIAALKQIAKFAEDTWGFSCSFPWVNVLEAFSPDKRLKLQAECFPKRQGRGLHVTLWTGNSARNGNIRIAMFDGQDYRYMHPESDGLVLLNDWLEEHYAS